MSDRPVSPFQSNPPSARSLTLSVFLALVLAGCILLFAVLPAEYGLDPTGIGRVLGLTQMSQKGASRKITLVDTLGGNGTLGKAQVPATGEPIPLPNPAVRQKQAEPAKSETFTITLPPDGETEIKTVLSNGKMLLYSWKVDHGAIYVDFHGHDPSWADKTAFVRYEEKDGSAGDNGSLVAPFTGEHGWYWLNTNDFPVVVTLNVSGYYDKIVNYGVRVQ